MARMLDEVHELNKDYKCVPDGDGHTIQSKKIYQDTPLDEALEKLSYHNRVEEKLK